MKPALTLSARSAEELEQISSWLLDCWLDAPVGPVAADCTLRLRITKDPAEVDVPDPNSGLPQPRNHRVTRWYEEWERPLVGCTITIRHVEEVVVGLEDPNPLFAWVEYNEADRTLDFDEQVLRVRVSQIDVQLDVMPEPVGWRRHRSWQIGPLGFQSGDRLPEPDE
jgi:hypothetical protein